MKKYGHTGTLFIEKGKYKWSYNYNNCVICGTCNYAHKGKGLCFHCREVERSKQKKRQIQIKINKTKYGIRKRIKYRLKNKYRKPTGNEKFYGKATEEKTRQSKLKSSRKYYKNNRELHNLLGKIYRMKKSGKKCIEIIINGKPRQLPFEDFTKPKTTTDPDYNVWKEKERQFLILKKYYESIGKKKSILK